MKSIWQGHIYFNFSCIWIDRKTLCLGVIEVLYSNNKNDTYKFLDTTLVTIFSQEMDSAYMESAMEPTSCERVIVEVNLKVVYLTLL